MFLDTSIRRFRLPASLSLLLLAGLPEARAAELDRLEGKTVHFKTTQPEEPIPPLTLPLETPKVIGLLKPTGGGLPYVLVSNADRELHLIRADGAKKAAMVHPGRIIDPRTGLKVLDSKAYFGRCLPRSGEVFVAYQSEQVERKRRKRKRIAIEPSIFVAEPYKDGIQEKLQELRTLGSLAQKERETLRRVKLKQCFEIAGINRDASRETISLKKELEEPDDDDEPNLKEDGEPEGEAPSKAAGGTPNKPVAAADG